MNKMTDTIKSYTENIFTITAKEFRTYFNSPIAYVVVVVFLLISGWFFTSTLFLNDQVSINQFLDNVPLLYIFLIPAISMKLIADEIKVGTIEILATMPIKDYEIVIGKYLATCGLLCVMLGLTLIYPISLSLLVKGPGLDWGQVVGAYIGLVCMGTALLSVGIFASAITRNQIIAFILGFLICFVFFILGKFVQILPGFIGNIVNFIGLDSHYNNISKGVIDSRDLLYYASLIGFFLYVSTVIVGARKWK